MIIVRKKSPNTTIGPYYICPNIDPKVTGDCVSGRWSMCSCAIFYGSATQVELLLQGMSGNEVAMLLAARIWIALSVLVFLERAGVCINGVLVTLEFCNSWEVWRYKRTVDPILDCSGLRSYESNQKTSTY